MGVQDYKFGLVGWKSFLGPADVGWLNQGPGVVNSDLRIHTAGIGYTGGGCSVTS